MFDLDLGVTLGGFLVGIVVGLTGMGGGALMTPMLVLFFGVQPLAAVSSDLVASAVMKPVGSAVHLRKGTVNLDLVKWLCVGSIPAAFLGVLILRWLGDGERIQSTVKIALGVALLLAAGSLVTKAYTQMKARARRVAEGLPPESAETGAPVIDVRVGPTILVGVLGGLVVGMTSVGSGSLIIVCLLALYPRLSANRLVGTDLVQAVPLVLSAAVAHLIFGDFQLDLTTSLLLGAIPGVWLGAHGSSVLPGGLIRRALVLVLVASALKLLGASTTVLGVVLVAIIVAAPALWAWARKRHGLPAFRRAERAPSQPAEETERVSSA